ncbi:FAD-binding oxidoreductase [Rhizobiaceae bacterium BDR2-2]|uniref:FAD-binding oxidoreductase n=1 Tax=Ectorhizobium quercum TaxID=2965071 RepID=A0AAE3ST35_9HYPH|nr:FAD-binding oxidoreductase [Ectorhizobium quercum]MCX8995527.1 FAD-binding oxidoreductase [Ectorhizobium quercum]
MLEPKHIAVIGGGIVGASSALALARSGQRVTLIEPDQPGGTQAASYGNGAFLSPASIIPMSMPGIWKKVPGYLLDPQGPLTIRWRYLARLAPWLVRFLYAGYSLEKVQRTAAVLWSLVGDSPSRHAALAESCGHPEMIHRDGLIYAYTDRAAFEEDALAWRLRRENGLVWHELSADELHELEPALGASYSFAAFVEAGGHCVDPGGFVAAIVAQAEREGITVRKANAKDFAFANGRLKAVLTDAGTIACDGAVIAAGVHSRSLAARAGDDIPLESERGYHVELANPSVTLRRPVMPVDGRMANIMTAGGLRASGQVELASIEAAPDWKRADILRDHLLRTYPALAASRADLRISRWYGHRPSTPDGLPVISRASASEDVIHAFGHGHIGLSAGPMTGELVASLVTRKTPPFDPAPFSAARFR